MMSQPAAMKAKQKAQVDGSGNIVVQAVDSTVTIGTRPHLTLFPPRILAPLTRPAIHLLNPYRRTLALGGQSGRSF